MIETLSDWGVAEDVVELASLVTSELVANAVNHAPPPGHLWVRADGHRVRIEVGDSSEREPRMVLPGDSVSGGRGLLLIDRLASRWGWDLRSPGKIVWCELNLTAAGDRR